MIEADGTDKNGGVFSRSATSSKPTLIKRFGDWNTEIENFVKYPIRVEHGVLAALDPNHPEPPVCKI